MKSLYINIFINFSEKLKFNPVPKNTFIELLDRNASVTCKAEGDGQVRIKWFKDNSINIASHVTNIDGVLHFYNVQRSDAGTYICRAYNDHQGSINASIYIEVVGRCDI